MNPYKWLWSRIGGRPWSFISRDVWHKYEYVPIVAIAIFNYWVGRSGLVSWGWYWLIIITFTIGYIIGHFFWGKEYIPGQRG